MSVVPGLKDESDMTETPVPEFGGGPTPGGDGDHDGDHDEDDEDEEDDDDDSYSTESGGFGIKKMTKRPTETGSDDDEEQDEPMTMEELEYMMALQAEKEHNQKEEARKRQHVKDYMEYRHDNLFEWEPLPFAPQKSAESVRESQVSPIVVKPADEKATICSGANMHQALLKRNDVEDSVKAQFAKLQAIFDEADADGDPGLDPEEFKVAMRATAHDQLMSTNATDLTDEDYDILFMKVDSNCDGTVDYQEYLSYILLEYCEKDLMAQMALEMPFTKPLRFIKQSYTRENIVKIEFRTTRINPGKDDETSHFAHGRYVSVTREGTVSFWTMNLIPQQTFQINSSVTDVSGDPSTKLWVTDMVLLPNFNMIAFSTTSQAIHFYDLNAMMFIEYVQLIGLKFCATRMHSWFDRQRPEKAILCWGDTRGTIYAIKFESCSNGGPFGVIKPDFTGARTINIDYAMRNESKYNLSFHIHENVHNEWIMQIQYIPSIKCIVSCSYDSEKSMYLADITKSRYQHHFSVDRGFLCFAYSKDHNYLVTGGLDSTVRVWNPYLPKKAIAIMTGHTRPVNYVLVDPVSERVISIALDKTIRIYELRDQSCLQTIRGSRVQMGPSRITSSFYNPKSKQLILGTNYLAVFDPQVEDAHAVVTSHNKQICRAMYNTKFDYIVSGSYDSSVAVWALWSGEKMMQFVNCHTTIGDFGERQSVEITAMAFDPPERRLVTGFRDGMVKIYNFNNGSCLRTIEPPDRLEVTGAVFDGPSHSLLVVGWNKRVVEFLDVKNETSDSSHRNWARFHREDILWADTFNNFLATCDYSGNILIWNTETRAPYYRFHALFSIVAENSIKKPTPGYPPTHHCLDLDTVLAPSAAYNPSKSSDEKSAAFTTESKVLPSATITQVSETVASDQQSTLELGGVKQVTSVRVKDANHNAVAPKVNNNSGGRRDNMGTPGSTRASIRDQQTVTSVKERTHGHHPGPGQSDLKTLEERTIHQVSRIQWLKYRRPHPRTASILACGGQGWVSAYSMHQVGGLVGQFKASHNPGESTCAMTTDPTNQYLVTGDSQGFIKFWDITRWCLASEHYEENDRLQRINKAKFILWSQEKREFDRYLLQKRAEGWVCPGINKKLFTRRSDVYNEHNEGVLSQHCRRIFPGNDQPINPPPILASWRAHIRGIISLELVHQREILVSASYDHAIRIWTMCGRYIGTFGEKQHWSLGRDMFIPHDPRTVMYRRVHEVQRVASEVTIATLKVGIKPRPTLRTFVQTKIIEGFRLKRMHYNMMQFQAERAEKDGTARQKIQGSANKIPYKGILGKHWHQKFQHRHMPRVHIPTIRGRVLPFRKLPVHETLPLPQDMSQIDIDYLPRKIIHQMQTRPERANFGEVLNRSKNREMFENYRLMEPPARIKGIIRGKKPVTEDQVANRKLTLRPSGLEDFNNEGQKKNLNEEDALRYWEDELFYATVLNRPMEDPFLDCKKSVVKKKGAKGKSDESHSFGHINNTSTSATMGV